MQRERFWEIDFLRGIAVVLMIIFNYAFALRYLRIYAFDANWLFWWLFPRLIAGIFIFLVGVSLSVSYSRRKRYKYGIDLYKKYIFRGAGIFLLGLIITAVTWYLFPNAAIFFGILHFIGLSIILSPIFIRFNYENIIFAALFILVGIYFSTFAVDVHSLLWLGLIPENFYTFDYFPIFPWFGIILFGIFFGGKLYKNGKRNFRIRKQPSKFFLPCFLGRHSLIIYFLHQPLLIAVLYLLGHTIF